jgi:VanZ family protein
MKWYYYLATALYCAAIFMLSSQEELPGTRRLVPHTDKLAHAVIYGGLAALVSIGIRRSNDYVPPAVQFLVPIGFATLYGITDEVHQLFVDNRAFEVMDMVANAAGAVLVQIFLCFKLWKLHLRHETPS